MGKKNIKSVIILVSIISLVIIPTYCSANIMITDNLDPWITISLLVPENNARCLSWATILLEQLPKIGIYINVFDTANFSEIAQRTWAYQGPYPIPSYQEGGYDILINSYESDMDYNPLGLYESHFITPFGDNYLQYENNQIDLAIADYSQSYNFTDRLNSAAEIQAHLYEDVPSIAAVYLQKLLIHDSNLEGWDSLLWEKDYQSMASWNISQETTFSYAQIEASDDFHMYFCDSKSEAQWLHQIYESLIERKTNLNGFYGSNIATDWFTNNGLTYTVNLHPDAVWADGEPLNASDIEYSFKLRGNISTTYTIADYCYKLTNVTIIDDDTLEFDFLEKNVFQENILALPIIPKHIWSNIAPENHSSQANTWALTNPTNLIGAGPYYLYDYNNYTEIIHLKRNEYYKNWMNIEPKFEDIYFKLYNNKDSALADIAIGKIDFMDSLFSSHFGEVPINASYSLVNSGNVQLLEVNNKHPYLGTGNLCPIAFPGSAKHLRKAISHMIPRELIIDEIYEGMGSPGITPWSNIAVDFDETLEPYEYSLDLADHHMQGAGFVYPRYSPCTSTTAVGLSIGLVFVISIISVIALTYLVRKRN